MQVFLWHRRRASDVTLGLGFWPAEAHEQNETDEYGEGNEEGEVKERPSHVIVLSNFTGVDYIVADNWLLDLYCHQ